MSFTGAKYTSARGNAVALHQALKSYGIDPEPIFQAGRVDFAGLEDHHRIPGEDMDKMVCLAVEATGDPAFGLRFTAYIRPNSYHALGVALLYSPTLRSFCQRLVRYFAIISNMDDLSLEKSGDEVSLVVRPRFEYREPAARVNGDAWAAYLVTSMQTVCDPGFSPLRVDLAWSPPRALRPRYEALFNCPINYGAELVRVHLGVAALDVPLPSSNVELARQNDRVVADFLASLADQDLPSRVHIKMIELLPSGLCDRENIASALNMTVRTMHNRLEREGTNYKEILESTREELARAYLLKGQHSISDIAYLLGYAEVGNFSRAFKRWTGKSPKNYLRARPCEMVISI